jgi:hypothetical protein
VPELVLVYLIEIKSYFEEMAKRGEGRSVAIRNV